jgi:hypothetical protein
MYVRTVLEIEEWMLWRDLAQYVTYSTILNVWSLFVKKINYNET